MIGRSQSKESDTMKPTRKQKEILKKFIHDTMKHTFPALDTTPPEPAKDSIKKRKFKLVNSAGDYDFYVGTDNRDQPLYNVIPKGEKIPTGGYYDKEYISNIKNVDSINFTVSIN